MHRQTAGDHLRRKTAAYRQQECTSGHIPVRRSENPCGFYSHSAFGGIDDVNLPVTIAGIDRPRYDLIGRIGVELNVVLGVTVPRTFCGAATGAGVVPVCTFAAPALPISADAAMQPASVTLIIFLNLFML